MADRYLNTNEIALEELKHQLLVESLAGLNWTVAREYDVGMGKIMQFCHANNKQIVLYNHLLVSRNKQMMTS